MRKYAMIKILEQLSEYGSTPTSALCEAIDDLNIPKATFYRALRELAIRGAILKSEYTLMSGKRLTEYRINIYAISIDERQNH